MDNIQRRLDQPYIRFLYLVASIFVLSAALTGCMHSPNSSNTSNETANETDHTRRMNSSEIEEVRAWLNGSRGSYTTGESYSFFGFNVEAVTSTNNTRKEHRIRGTTGSEAVLIANILRDARYTYTVGGETFTDKSYKMDGPPDINVYIDDIVSGEEYSGTLLRNATDEGVANTTIFEETYRVELGNRSQWHLEIFTDEHYKILNSEVRNATARRTGNETVYRIHFEPDRETVAEYFNSMYTTVTGREILNLSAEDIDTYEAVARAKIENSNLSSIRDRRLVVSAEGDDWSLEARSGAPMEPIME